VTGELAEFEQWSTRKKYEALLGASITAFILLALVSAVLVYCGQGHWIELFNGATWPVPFTPSLDATIEQRHATYGFWFFVVLTARTFINLGVVLSAVLAVFWLATGGLGRLVMKQLETLSRMRTSALVGEMLAVLEAAHVEVPPEVEKKMYEAARQFDKSSFGQAIKKRAAEAGAPV
jgi:hypothetical protein